jgi:hypothetical protein
VRARERRQLVGVAADEYRIGHCAIAVREHDAALRADRGDRPDQMLVRSHPAGDAVHDDAESPLRHCAFLSQCVASVSRMPRT